jgi:hypothetical protein
MLSLSLYAAAYSAIDLILIYIHPSIRIFSVFFFVSFIVHSVCRDVFDMSDKSYALTIQEQRVTYTIISESNLYACTPQSKIRPHTSIIEYMFLINFVQARNKAVLIGLGVTLILLCIVSHTPWTKSQFGLKISDDKRVLPKVFYKGFPLPDTIKSEKQDKSTKPFVPSEEQYNPEITWEKATVHFLVDLTKLAAVRYLVTLIELLVLLGMQFYRKLL